MKIDKPNKGAKTGFLNNSLKIFGQKLLLLKWYAYPEKCEKSINFIWDRPYTVSPSSCTFCNIF
jgi:hypothetical protein